MRKKRLAKSDRPNRCVKIRGSKERSSSAKFPADLQDLYIARKEFQETKVLPNSKSGNLHKHHSGAQLCSNIGPSHDIRTRAQILCYFSYQIPPPALHK